MAKLIISILLMLPGIMLIIGFVLIEIANNESKEIIFTLVLIGIIILFTFGISSLMDWYLERHE